MVDFLRLQLIGPVGGAMEILRDPPDQRYSMGVLYPLGAEQGDVALEQVDDDQAGAYADTIVDDPIALASQWMPSSLGVSFFVLGGEGVECRVAGAAYDEVTLEKKRSFPRIPIAELSSPEVVRVGWAAGMSSEMTVLEGRGRVRVHTRPLGDGLLVSVTVCNARQSAAEGRPSATDCLYQVGLECRAIGGSIAEYPRLEFLSADDEEEELFLAFRKKRVFAIGHGCAASWEAVGQAAESVRAEIVPSHEVPSLAPRGDDSLDVLDLHRLGCPRLDAAWLERGATALIDGYATWISELEQRRDYPPALEAARGRILRKVREAERRMRIGVQTLVHDPVALEAFRLANRAMLIQMHRAKTVAPVGVPLGKGDPSVVDYDSLEGHRWYPFQLAFMLLVLPSLSSADAPDRDVVDLLWFPTGGGKTEAYLLAASFVIFLRRLEHGDRGAGTAVMTRYTLRLLTTQQFQRAAALACAAEWLRAADPERLGSVPIDIGLWVGGDAFPNHYVEAKDWLEQVLDGASDDVMPVEHCPWCGTNLLPRHRADDGLEIGVEATNASFRLFCPEPSCPFHHRLPVLVVDDDLYAHPPAILIGTVDKFARLVWSDQGGAFFGLGRYAPPTLIIQDEMHLISGPLGTTVGLYESAIGGLLDLAGARPKVIASTATIRRADDQALGIFGRSVSLFPPAGMDEDDSYFSRVATDRPGRLYVGVMSPNHTPSSSLIHSAAALLQGPNALELSGKDLDAMWTLVVYHNSLRELGKVVTFARDDIPARIQVISEIEDKRRLFSDHQVVELTSNIASAQIPAILRRMAEPNSKPDSISMLLATNMIQVGIDVPRLGLMLVNGQPKTTSEYIQATSRVGRGETPGLVVAQLSPSKPRDRSHYESFVAFHQALYRHVEPTSVTPFSLPSRERALHAALVILVRHGAGLAANGDAGKFRADDPDVQRAIEVLLARAQATDPLEVAATRAHLQNLVREWEERAEAARNDGTPLVYSASGKALRRLLTRFGMPGEGWPTLDSMRSVDRQSAVNVIGGLAGA
jgi:hypothetical protein